MIHMIGEATTQVENVHRITQTVKLEISVLVLIAGMWVKLKYKHFPRGHSGLHDVCMYCI